MSGPVKRIGVGVVGMGWMGGVHSRSYLQIPQRFPEAGVQPELVICADDVAARRQAAESTLGFAASSDDWRVVVEHPDVDAVDVTAPNWLHHEIATAAAQAGKHVFCEKPAGRTPEETRAIAAAADAAGVVTGVGYNYRWAPMVQYARQLIESGDLGALTHYRGRFFAGYARSEHAVLSWRFQEEHAGAGTLGDLMSHVIDMAHFIAGPIDAVVANQKTFIAERPLAPEVEGTHFTERVGGPSGAVTNEDYVGVLVRFASGAQGTLEGCRVIAAHDCQMALETNGRRGAASWDFERMNELRLAREDAAGNLRGFQVVPSGPDHPFHLNFNPGPAIGLSYEDTLVIELHDFVRGIVEGKQGPTGLGAAVAVADVQDAIRRSWRSGSWESVGDTGAASAAARTEP